MILFPLQTCEIKWKHLPPGETKPPDQVWSGGCSFEHWEARTLTRRYGLAFFARLLGDADVLRCVVFHTVFVLRGRIHDAPTLVKGRICKYLCAAGLDYGHSRTVIVLL
jgi:hypothetical protein